MKFVHQCKDHKRWVAFGIYANQIALVLLRDCEKYAEVRFQLYWRRCRDTSFTGARVSPASGGQAAGS